MGRPNRLGAVPSPSAKLATMMPFELKPPGVVVSGFEHDREDAHCALSPVPRDMGLD